MMWVAEEAVVREVFILYWSEVRGKSEIRKEARLNALPLRTETFDEAIRSNKD